MQLGDMNESNGLDGAEAVSSSMSLPNPFTPLLLTVAKLPSPSPILQRTLIRLHRATNLFATQAIAKNWLNLSALLSTLAAELEEDGRPEYDAVSTAVETTKAEVQGLLEASHQKKRKSDDLGEMSDDPGARLSKPFREVNGFPGKHRIGPDTPSEAATNDLQSATSLYTILRTSSNPSALLEPLTHVQLTAELAHLQSLPEETGTWSRARELVVKIVKGILVVLPGGGEMMPKVMEVLKASPAEVEDTTGRMLVDQLYTILSLLAPYFPTVAIPSEPSSSSPVRPALVSLLTALVHIHSLSPPLTDLQSSVVRAVLTAEAQAKERRSITILFGPAVEEPRHLGTLLDALFAKVPVALGFTPPAGTHRLPYWLQVPSHTIYTLQNLLQLLTTTATLVALLPPPVPVEFVSRIVATLDTALTSPDGDIVLDDLTREMERVAGGIGWGEKVEACVKMESPVWGVLSGRLRKGIEDAVHRNADAQAVGTMRTGRIIGEGASIERPTREMTVGVKGFESGDLGRRIGAVVEELRRVVKWVEGTWGLVDGVATVTR